MVVRPCITDGCTGLARTGPRCPTCQRAQPSRRKPWYDDTAYRQARARIQAEATHCHACGTPFGPGNPPTADHVPPVHTVDDWRQCAILPACAPCNSGGKHHR